MSFDNFNVYIFTLPFSIKAHSCLSGWLTHGSKCYHFSHDKEEWVNAVVS
jgi:hypothetical protein